MPFSKDFIAHLQNLQGFDEKEFLLAHQHPAKVSVRAHPHKNFPFERSKQVPWNEHGYYFENRPDFTLDPFFQSGNYYVQDASSMFVQFALKNLDLPKQPNLLDLCASPGGKSTDILSFLNGNGLLVSNEISPKRVAALVHNISKWSYPNVLISHLAPQQMTNSYRHYDVVLVDAPCSGSGMFRKMPEWADSWSLKLVKECSDRQRKILTDLIPNMKENSFLIYSTCSFSKEENESIIEFVQMNFEVENVKLELPENWGIVKSQIAGIDTYRFWPDKIAGEGFFIAIMKIKHQTLKVRADKGFTSSKKLKNNSPDFMAETAREDIYQEQDKVYYWTPAVKNFYESNSNIRWVKRGVLVGEMKGKDFIPSYDFALSGCVHHNVPRLALSKLDAIRYLRRENLNLSTQNLAKGWALVEHENCPLGWSKILEGRINNYYPLEYRVLKMPDDNGL